MPRTSAIRQQRLTEFRCGEILGAARRVFADRGFDAATVDEVAAAAGVAKGTLYLYYRSKRDIYWAALRSGVLELHELVKTRLAAARTADELIGAFVETKVDYYEAHRDFFRIYYVEFASATLHPSQAYPELRALFNEQIALLASGLDRLGPRTARRLPLGEVAFAVAEITRGLVFRRLIAEPAGPGIVAPRPTTAAADAAFVLELVLHGIGGARS